MSRVQVPSAAPIQLADRLCRDPARGGGPGRKGTAAREPRPDASLRLGGNAVRVPLPSVGPLTQSCCRSLPAPATHTNASSSAVLRIELSLIDAHDTGN